MSKVYIKKISLSGRGTPREITSLVMQSPLAGVSDLVFRKLIRKWAPRAILFTEMVNANSLNLGFGEEKLLDLSKEKGPIGVQLFDFRPSEMAKAARKAEEAGAFLIDINMGCPVRKITKKGGGSALLKDPQLAVQIIKQICATVNIPVTVKMRLGWCKKSANPIEFANRLQEAGVEMITVHGRTREQGFSGKSNWDAIAKIKQSLEIPIIANGDINNSFDAFNCLRETGADGIMIGRGSMGAPWLIGQIDADLKSEKPIKEPEPKEKVEIALEQLQSLIKIKGDHGLLIARKHLSWTCKGFSGSCQLRKDLVRAKTPLEAIDLLNNQLELL
tara:strand:+ start:947 stop:1942 length:996 start_codon:yes stop_codon:yes gene_type:complete